MSSVVASMLDPRTRGDGLTTKRTGVTTHRNPHTGLASGQLRTRPDSLDAGDPRVQSAQTRVSPVSAPRTVAQLGHGHERDEDGAPNQERLVRRCQRRTNLEQVGAEDAGV